MFVQILEGFISQGRFRWLARPKRRLSDSYFLVEEPAKAVATPREMSIPPET